MTTMGALHLKERKASSAYVFCIVGKAKDHRISTSQKSGRRSFYNPVLKVSNIDFG